MLMLQEQPVGIVPTGSHPLDRPPRIPEAVGPEQFDPADLRCWLNRGRSIEQATELARIWRAHPDLPATAPLADRMERGRERIAAMKPLNDAIAARTEADRQTRNFSFMEARAASGTISDNDIAILRGRDLYGYATSTGDRLAPEIIVSNKTNIRREMAAALRAFGGATRLMDACG
jgi:hypothetical protein